MTHRIPPRHHQEPKPKPRKLLVWWQMLLVAGMIIGTELGATLRYYFDKVFSKSRK